MIPWLALLVYLLPASGPQAAPESKGSIEGIVLRSETNQPVGATTVSLSRPNSDLLGATPSVRVTTEIDGRFVFKNIDPGFYRLTFANDGYVWQEYGQRIFPGKGAPIEVTAGHVVKDVVVHLIPTGSVSGRIRDRDGQPLVNVPVQLMRPSYGTEGRRTFRPLGNAQTNDQGEYRLYFITPGRYYLHVGTPQGANITVGRNEVRGVYANMFYPGVASVSQASGIDIRPGSDLRGFDMTLARQEVFRVLGRIIDSRTGQPPTNPTLQLNYRDPGTGWDNYVTAAENMTYDSGVFEFRNVVPGSYSVSATIRDPAAPVTEATGGQQRTNVSLRRTSYTRVDVIDSDVDGVVLTVMHSGAISGRFRVEGTELALSAGPMVGIQLTPSMNGKPPTLPGLPTPDFGTLNTNGAFRMDSVMPGEYRIGIAAVEPAFFIKEARFEGVDVLHTPLQFTGSALGLLEIVISTNVASIDGAVTGERLEPIAAAQVVLVPDRYREHTALFRTATTDKNGRFSITNVAPGDYKVFAWEALEPYAYFDPDLLKQVDPKGRPVHLGERARETVDVKVIAAPIQ